MNISGFSQNYNTIYKDGILSKNSNPHAFRDTVNICNDEYSTTEVPPLFISKIYMFVKLMLKDSNSILIPKSDKYSLLIILNISFF